ncbi:hypothetical protein F5Y11DRAFT_342899 [Daldinia sp. FL1419]|nr:hypothetical protein F5Y11DRAFT_342899 [Daldinia sp. FL1419]
MSRVVYESPRKLTRRDGNEEHDRGLISKTYPLKRPLEAVSGWYNTNSRGNRKDINTINNIPARRNQSMRTPEFDASERPLSKRPRVYSDRKQLGDNAGNNMLSIHDRLPLDPGTDGYDYQGAYENVSKYRPSWYPGVVLGYNSAQCRCPFWEYLDFPSNGVVNPGQPTYLTPNCESGSGSPCSSEHRRTTDEPENAESLLCGMDKEDLALFSSIESHTSGDLENRGEKDPRKVLKQENDENESNKGSLETGDNHEDQVSDVDIGTQIIPTIQPSGIYNITEVLDRKDSWKSQSIDSSSDEIYPRKRRLACLWYKKDPVKYSGCAKYKLLRIKDVKQHTYRRHMKPSIYCDVCLQVFSKEEERKRHTRENSCTRKTKLELDGLSEEQRKKLNQSANRGKNDVERWFYMWDAIFPGERRPLSPYLGNGRQELLPLLRNFWKEKHGEIILKVLRESHLKLEPETIQNVMNAVFDKFEAESSSWTDESSDVESTGTSNSQTQSPGTTNDIDLGNCPLLPYFTNYDASYEALGQSIYGFNYAPRYSNIESENDWALRTYSIDNMEHSYY